MNQDNTNEHKTIRIDRKKLIDAIVWNQDPNNYENGYHGVHIQRWLFDDETGVIDATVRFYQSGNYYPPGTSHVCEFGVMAFLDEDAFRRDASWDDLDDSYSDLRKEAQEAGENPQDWVDASEEYLREVISNCLITHVLQILT